MPKARTRTIDRIDHGGGHFVFDLLRLFLELGETVQNKLKHAAEFARLDHVDVELVEDARVLREGFGERAAALHRVGELINRLF